MATAPRPLREAIAASADSGAQRALFGDALGDEVAEQIERHCAVHLGADPVSVRFWSARRGITAGLSLDDGTSVVLQLGDKRHERALVARCQVLRHLAQAGLPVPTVLAAPSALGLGVVLTLSFAEVGGAFTAEPRDARRLCGETLAAIARAVHELAVPPDLPEDTLAPPRRGPLWPASTELDDDDFEPSEDEGLAAIVELASAARSLIARAQVPSAEHALHLALGGEHVATDRGRVVATFGWSQLRRSTELVAVARAAMHPERARADEAPLRWPTPDESDLLVAAFVEQRGQAFDEASRRALAAQRTYALALAARREHQLHAPAARGSAEEMLLRYGERYLVVRG